MVRAPRLPATVWVQDPTGGSALVRYDPAKQPSDKPFPIDLEAGLTITGFVRDLPEGGEMVRRSISAVQGRYVARGIVHPDGRFEVPGLLKGTWHLSLTVTQMNPVVFKRAEAGSVAAGSKDVELVWEK